MSQIVYERHGQDDHILAKIQEEMDFKTNVGKANRVLFINVKGDKIPERLQDYKGKLSGLIRPLLQKSGLQSTFEILPRRGAIRNGFYPPFEVKFALASTASQFRKSVLKELRLNPGFERSIMAPSVTLATRVRYEIMRAISAKLSSAESRGFCPMFAIRPVLHVGPLVNEKVVPRSTLTFVDAVKKYGDLLSDDDLDQAYARAGQLFRGSMRQTFIVLREVQENPGKRHREPSISIIQEGEPDKKKERVETVTGSK